MCRRIGQYISLELIYFVNLIGSCSLSHSLDTNGNSKQCKHLHLFLHHADSGRHCAGGQVIARSVGPHLSVSVTDADTHKHTRQPCPPAKHTRAQFQDDLLSTPHLRNSHTQKHSACQLQLCDPDHVSAHHRNYTLLKTISTDRNWLRHNQCCCFSATSIENTANHKERYRHTICYRTWHVYAIRRRCGDEDEQVPRWPELISR